MLIYILAAFFFKTTLKCARNYLITMFTPYLNIKKIKYRLQYNLDIVQERQCLNNQMYIL